MLAIGGCTVGPDFTTPKAAVNKDWCEKGDPQFAANAAVNNRWWKGFNDPALDKLVQLAHQNNLSLQTAGLRILEARARLGIAIGLQYPQTQELFGSATGVGLSKHAPNNAIARRNFYDYQAGFDASWELDFWGKYRRGVEAERAELTASVADYDDALVSLTAEVARTYVSIRTFEVLLALARDNIKVQEDGLQLAESRYRHGATTELDVTQAQTLLESTRATVPDLEAKLRQAEDALCTLLGQTPGTVRTLLGGPRAIPSPPAHVAVGVPAELTAPPPGHPPRRTQCRRAECPDRHSQIGPLPERVDLGPGGLRDQQQWRDSVPTRELPQSLRRRKLLLRLGSGGAVAHIQLRPHQGQRAHPGMRSFSSCWFSIKTRCSAPRRKWKTRRLVSSKSSKALPCCRSRWMPPSGR